MEILQKVDGLEASIIRIPTDIYLDELDRHIQSGEHSLGPRVRLRQIARDEIADILRTPHMYEWVESGPVERQSCMVTYSQLDAPLKAEKGLDGANSATSEGADELVDGKMGPKTSETVHAFQESMKETGMEELDRHWWIFPAIFAVAFVVQFLFSGVLFNLQWIPLGVLLGAGTCSMICITRDMRRIQRNEVRRIQLERTLTDPYYSVGESYHRLWDIVEPQFALSRHFYLDKPEEATEEMVRSLVDGGCRVQKGAEVDS